MMCSLCLQGCRSSFRVTSEEPTLKKLRRTSDDERAMDQASVPDSSSFVLPNVPGSRLPTAAPIVLPSVRITLPVHDLSVRRDVVPTWEQVSSTEVEAIDKKPAPKVTAQVTKLSSSGCLASLFTLSFQVPTVFGAQEWRQYFGEVGATPRLPLDIVEILHSPCPFWPGKAVRDTHLLVLIPSTVDGKAFTLDLLEELVQNPRGDSYSTQYFLYDDEVQQSSGDAYSSSAYWVLLTRDVLPGSRNKPYAVQQELVAARAPCVDRSSYEIPCVLEVATAILSHYVRSGNRLYKGTGDALPSTYTRCAELLGDASGHPSPVTVGHFCSRGLVFLSGFNDDEEFGISCLRRFGTRNCRPSALLHSFGAEEWRQYFGEVGEAPPLPAHIVAMLNSPCPFWPEKQVKDTHLLVLIPATVSRKPFNLNLLGALIKHPKGGGNPTKFRCYYGSVQGAIGARSPEKSYWVLMTRGVLEGSRDETYTAQRDLVAACAREVGLPYELPGALEVAATILLHYVRSGERIYTDVPWTYTRCRDVVDNQYPVVVGGFSPKGICIDDHYSIEGRLDDGIASLRRF